MSEGVVHYVKCPGCSSVRLEHDYAGQKAHLEAEHPEIVAERMAESRRLDGWVND
jgi:hypothetical protein